MALLPKAYKYTKLKIRLCILTHIGLVLLPFSAVCASDLLKNDYTEFPDCSRAFLIAKAALESNSEIGKVTHPTLSIEFEQELFARLRQARAEGDKEAEEHIATIFIGLNLKLHLKIVSRYRIPNLTHFEVLDEVNAHLFTQFWRFDPDRGIRYNTVSGEYVKNYLYGLAHKARRRGRHETTVSQLKATVNEDDRSTQWALEAEPVHHLSMEQSEQRRLNARTLSMLLKVFDDAMEHPKKYDLTEKEALVLSLRYPFDGSLPLTFQRIADGDYIDGKTRAAARQIANKGLIKLKMYLRANMPRAFFEHEMFDGINSPIGRR